ncbi:hypothetical protein SAMN04487925_101656 [Bradyrhizobium sp. cf659]|nr:hypothetical protein SAMN04487925_101656 [Bradyrhizobium sp. cf659]
MEADKMQKLSKAELELLAKLRSGDPFRLAINCQGPREWTVTTAPALPEVHPVNTGGGYSFDDAWEHCHR